MRSKSTSRPPAAPPRQPWPALLALLTAVLFLTACSIQDLQPGPGLPGSATPTSPGSAAPQASPAGTNPPPPATTNPPAPPTATSGATGQPVSQGAPAVPPFVIYSAGKLAASWEDASWG